MTLSSRAQPFHCYFMLKNIWWSAVKTINFSVSNSSPSIALLPCHNRHHSLSIQTPGPENAENQVTVMLFTPSPSSKLHSSITGLIPFLEVYTVETGWDLELDGAGGGHFMSFNLGHASCWAPPWPPKLSTTFLSAAIIGVLHSQPASSTCRMPSVFSVWQADTSLLASVLTQFTYYTTTKMPQPCAPRH